MKKYLNQQDMRDLNLTNVFRLIRRHAPITRRQIEAQMALSWGAVFNATALLLQRGYIREVKASPCAGVGRTPIALSVNEEDHILLGLDVNLSGLTGVGIAATGRVLFSLHREPVATDREGWLREIRSATGALLELAKERHVLGLGVAVQGAVDAPSGISLSFPAAGWQNVPLAELLTAELGFPVFLEHDPNCILYAAEPESATRNAILLRADRGIGMAVMLEGQILQRCGALEVGRTVNEGQTLQSVATLQALSERGGMPLPLLAEKAERGDTAALAVFEKAARHLAVAVVNAAQLFDVNDILLCGKLLTYEALFLPRLREEATLLAPDRPLCIGITDVQGAAVGAALLALERLTLHFD